MATVRRENRTFTVVVAVLVGLGALVMLGLILLSGAPDILLLATVLASVPVVPLVACYLWLDRYEPEPRKLLALGLLWGAFGATSAAIVLQLVLSLGVDVGPEASLAVVAPVTEEATKGIFLVLLLWWRRHELDGILDGIVYAGLVGIGFAFTENILYLVAAYNGGDGLVPGDSLALTTTFVMRCLVSPFAHPLFTTFIGVGVGIAVGSRSVTVRVLAPLAGYALAVTTHGIWNGSTLYGAFLLAYLVLMVPVFVGLVAFAIWARSSERSMLQRALADAAARGLIPASDIPWVTDLRGRRSARRYAAGLGEQHARAMRDYQQAAIELGYLHHRYLRGTPPPDFAARGQQYVMRIGSMRPFLAFPGQVVPRR